MNNICDLCGNSEGQSVNIYGEDNDISTYLCAEDEHKFLNRMLDLKPTEILRTVENDHGETGLGFRNVLIPAVVELLEEMGIRYHTSSVCKVACNMILRPLNVLGIDYFVVSKDDLFSLLNSTRYKHVVYSTRDGHAVKQ